MTVKELYKKLDQYNFSNILNKVIFPKGMANEYEVYDAIIEAYPELEDCGLTADELIDYLTDKYTVGETEVSTIVLYRTDDFVTRRD